MESKAESQQPFTAREQELLNIWRESFPLSQGDPDLQMLIFGFLIKSGSVKPQEFAELLIHHKAEFIERSRPPDKNHIHIDDLEVEGKETFEALTEFFEESALSMQPGFMSIPDIDLAVEHDGLDYSDSREAYACIIGHGMIDRENYLLFSRANPGRKNRIPNSDPFMSIIREQILQPQPRFPLQPAYNDLTNALKDFLIDLAGPVEGESFAHYPRDTFYSSRTKLRELVQGWEEEHPGEQFFRNENGRIESKS
jgi:hypothetical protein